MDQFKIDHFNRDHPGSRFPWFQQLSKDKCEQLRSALALKLGIFPNQEPLALYQQVLDLAVSLEGFDADEPSFSLTAVLDALKIKPSYHAYINWYRFDDVDCFVFNELAEHFEDVCTGYLSGDVCVFDDSLEWILFIMHYGWLRIVDLSKIDNLPPATRTASPTTAWGCA